MSESNKQTTPRIAAAAKEFNVSINTIIDYLTSKGHAVDSKPNTKLSEDMYFALEEEYAKDKAAKRKSEAIELPKSNANNTISLGDESSIEIITPEKKSKKSTPEEAAPKAQPAPEPVVVPEPVEIPQPKVVEPEPVVVIESPVEKIEEAPIETPQEEKPAAVNDSEVEKEKQPSEALPPVENVDTPQEDNPVEKIDAPKLGGPKVITKIDLDAINTATRPTKKPKPKDVETDKKRTTSKTNGDKFSKDKVEPQDNNQAEGTKTPKSSDSDTKKETPITPSAAPAKPVESAPAAKEEKVQPPVKPTPPADDVPEHIEMVSPKLAGPKIVGKIELPIVDSSKNKKEKRKRKRIPVDGKKVDQAAPKKPGTDGQNRPNNNRPAGPNNNNDRNKSKRPDSKFNKSKTTPNTPTEIDAKEIQDKIRQTQAKLSGIGLKNKNLKSKNRRNKREELAEKRAADELRDNTVLQVTEFISVSELASLLDVNFTDIISKCMGLGIMVSINQRLDAEVIELVASEFGKEVEFIDLLEHSTQEDDEDDIDSEEDLLPRAPVVTIMGHVDHGKTSLLDYIRNANVVAGEAGGITQHIGAYKVKTAAGNEITFLDTPGHEAFTAMRARGAKAADIAVIVVAADDAIMPQTKEAISHAQAANLPMVFAINKIDKEGANPEKIKEQLASMNILVEDWGGQYQCQEVSAKKGINMDVLLEKIILEAELLELKANPNRTAIGTIVEASLDKGRGYVTSLLVQTGTLQQGDLILSGQYYGKIKAMFNERGQKVTKAGPSTPVQILGLNGASQAGETFKVYTDETEAKSIANHRAQILREQGLRSKKHITLDEIGRRLALGNFKELNVIIKADFDGSAEALSDSLQKLSTEEVVVNVVLKGVGQISESDIMLASASDAIILGFQVRASHQAAKVAENENIEIRYYSIIYDAIEEIKSAMEGMLEPTIEKKIVGNIEVRETFKISGVGTIAGCYVLDGKFSRQTKINLIRDGIVIHTGELSSLKRYKDDVKEVSAGYECGLTLKNYNDIKVNDIIEGFEEVEVKRKL